MADMIKTFFNTSNFKVNNLTANPYVVPDEAFEFNFYIHDMNKQGTAVSIETSLVVIDGRDRTDITNAPNDYQVDTNTWEVSAVIPSNEWDGEKTVLIVFKIRDIADAMHVVEYPLVKEE